MNDNTPSMTQSQFLMGAGVFEGAILFLAFVGGWLTGFHPTATLYWSAQDFGLGVLATGPMLILLLICFLSRSKGMLQVREFVRQTIGPYLSESRWFDIVLLALLAGVCEEAFFRGFLFLWIQEWNQVLAVMITNLRPRACGDAGVCHAGRVSGPVSDSPDGRRSHAQSADPDHRTFPVRPDRVYGRHLGLPSTAV